MLLGRTYENRPITRDMLLPGADLRGADLRGAKLPPDYMEDVRSA